jgi:Glycosyl hydrolase family 12
VAYVRQPAASKVDNLDIRAFVKDSVTRGYIDPSFYLIAIEAGFEIWKGDAGFATSSFNATVAAR